MLVTEILQAKNFSWFSKNLTIFIDNERYPLHVFVRLFGIFLKSSFFRVCKFYLFISTFGLFLLQLLIWILRKYLFRQGFKNNLIEGSFPRNFLKSKTLEIVSGLQELEDSTHKGRSSAQLRRASPESPIGFAHNLTLYVSKKERSSAVASEGFARIPSLQFRSGTNFILLYIFIPR